MGVVVGRFRHVPANQTQDGGAGQSGDGAIVALVKPTFTPENFREDRLGVVGGKAGAKVEPSAVDNGADRGVILGFVGGQVFLKFLGVMLPFGREILAERRDRIVIDDAAGFSKYAGTVEICLMQLAEPLGCDRASHARSGLMMRCHDGCPPWRSEPRLAILPNSQHSGILVSFL